ncbi:MAG: twin-arginine translocase TatA/TatE family subunit [Phycisphaerae bacterium]|nr:twin-arginine translocase TatA/TatE family subunit [Phycisphaerae bacterium]
MAWMPGPWELMVILVVAILLFGRRLPEIARGMGKSITEFKKGLNEAKNEIDKDQDIKDIKKEIQSTVDTTNKTLNQD